MTKRFLAYDYDGTVAYESDSVDDLIDWMRANYDEIEEDRFTLVDWKNKEALPKIKSTEERA